ncbi:MAG: DUF2169 domain-containing protein [Sandaracinaceae bacterium]|nr:DUF2169 domain-containing protein [Sandaracinaceae bacterium]
MRITSPMFLCPLVRPFGVGQDNRLGISVLSAWTLAGAPLSVQDLWPRFGRAAGAETLIDAGIPKSASEWLLAGHAHADGPVTHLAVSVEVGAQRKVLHVVGDRAWRQGVPSAPEPFVSMPIDWRHAFGGEGFADNPLGKGYCKGASEGAELPNVERPGQMIDSPRDRPAPAGFGAYGIDSPERMRGLGTYDKAWLEQDFPGFARDIDWRVHNVAAADQRREAPFEPGERVVLHNLVEGRPRVELELPRVRARAFTYGKQDSAALNDVALNDVALNEVALAFRTLWLLPDEDMLVLVFHGAHPVRSALGSDVAGLVLGLDGADRARDIEHFERTLAKRLDRELGAAEMLDDRPLMPEGWTFPDFEERAVDLSMPARTGALEANFAAAAEERRARMLRLLSEAGLEGAEALFPAPAPVTSSGTVAEQLAAALAQAEERRVEAEAQLATLRERAFEDLRAMGVDPALLSPAAAGPPPILASERIAMLQRILADAEREGVPVGPFARLLDDPGFHRELFQKEAQGREAYRLTAHRTETLPERPPERLAAARAEVEAAIRYRSSLALQDLTGADLAELDLSGMDLSGAWLEGANLQKANLENARLDGAVLAKADLSEAILRGTSLRRANLGRARLLWTRLESCDLSDAILDSADLRGARVLRSTLARADLSGVRVEQTAFEASDLGSVTFLSMSLAGVTFVRCHFDGTTFVEVSLDGASFLESTMSKVVFVTCTGRGAVFYGANLTNARFVADCVFDGADFRHATLPSSTLRAGSFVGASFEEASLAGSDLSQAKLSKARLYRADLRRVLATECDLRSAYLAGANLMFAVLQGSDLRGADLRGANLHATDLALVHADTATSLEGALVTRTRHRPLRKETA